MAKRSKSYYFESFIEGAEFSLKAAKMLNDTLTGFKPQELYENIQKMHEIEHGADIAKHKMMSKLAKEFITPREREDIVRLSQGIDDVTDAIEDILLRAHMFNIKEVKPEALEFAKMIVACCEVQKALLAEFENFHKSATIYNLIVNVNDLEEKADALYTQSVHTLFSSTSDPVMLIVWNELFNRFEKCCDSLENVANIVESVIMKNV